MAYGVPDSYRDDNTIKVKISGLKPDKKSIGLWCNWQHVWFWSRRV